MIANQWSKGKYVGVKGDDCQFVTIPNDQGKMDTICRHEGESRSGTRKGKKERDIARRRERKLEVIGRLWS